jgi:hypothetical protein
MHPSIKRVWEHYEPEMLRCVARGDYYGEKVLRSRAIREAEEVRQSLIAERLQRPPFLTHQNGFFYMHPVTPDNEHLLREIG